MNTSNLVWKKDPWKWGREILVDENGKEYGSTENWQGNLSGYAITCIDGKVASEHFSYDDKFESIREKYRKVHDAVEREIKSYKKL